VARHGAWRSLVAHLLWEQRVAGSNPAAPTNFRTWLGNMPAKSVLVDGLGLRALLVAHKRAWAERRFEV
jgi:hypothetical protein